MVAEYKDRLFFPLFDQKNSVSGLSRNFRCFSLNSEKEATLGYGNNNYFDKD